MGTPEATGENEAAPSLQNLHIKGEFCTLCVCVYVCPTEELETFVGETTSLECKNTHFQVK